VTSGCYNSKGKKELNMLANIKTKNGKKLKVKALVDSGYTHTEIDEQLVKDKRIQMKPINFSFEVFNADGMKNREVTKVVPLEIEINGHKEKLEAAVMDLDRTDMFLGGRSLKLMAGQATQGRTHCGIKVKICSILLLYSKERWFIMVGSRLQEVKPGHNKG